MMYENNKKQKEKISVVIPCYRVKDHIEGVIASIPNFVDKIYCIDDACPDGSGDFIKAKIKNSRVQLLTHKINRGVGGAVITGYKQALKDGIDIVVKIDGDGQMNPALIASFINPIIMGTCDYTKGNRFYRIDDVKDMPSVRLFGNAVLSFMTKLSSGYWNLFDPTNGYTAVHSNLLKELQLDKLDNRYFFETDILFRLNMLRAVVQDIPMRAIYDDEESNLKIMKVFFPFLGGHLRNFAKRLFYSYFLRDFNIASVELVFGAIFLMFGLIFGITQWSHSLAQGIEASAGTVMLSALPIILGIQFLLSFLQYDIQMTPKTPQFLRK